MRVTREWSEARREGGRLSPAPALNGDIWGAEAGGVGGCYVTISTLSSDWDSSPDRFYGTRKQLILYIIIRRTLQVAIKNTRVLTKIFNRQWIIHTLIIVDWFVLFISDLDYTFLVCECLRVVNFYQWHCARGAEECWGNIIIASEKYREPWARAARQQEATSPSQPGSGILTSGSRPTWLGRASRSPLQSET